jgi:hypothetical protein
MQSFDKKNHDEILQKAMKSLALCWGSTTFTGCSEICLYKRKSGMPSSLMGKNYTLTLIH